MIKPFTFLCMLACVGSGMYLYTEKHSAELLDRQIAHVIHAKEAARQRTGLLRADWALLNEPGRLQTMADQYLALKPMAPNQFVQMADLGTHLPAPVAPPPPGTQAPDDADPAAPDAPASPDAATPGPDATIAATDLSPKPASADPGISDTPSPADKPAPAQLARANPAPHTAARLVAHLAPRPGKSAHSVAVADRDGYSHDNPLAHSAPLPLATPQPMGASVMSAMARPDHARARSAIGGWTGRAVVATAVPRMMAPAPYVGSALASSGRLPPPVPYGVQ